MYNISCSSQQLARSCFSYLFENTYVFFIYVFFMLGLDFRFISYFHWSKWQLAILAFGFDVDVVYIVSHLHVKLSDSELLSVVLRCSVDQEPQEDSPSPTPTCIRIYIVIVRYLHYSFLKSYHNMSSKNSKDTNVSTRL